MLNMDLLRRVIRRLSEKKGFLGFIVIWLRYSRSKSLREALEYAWNSHGYDLLHQVDTSHMAVSSEIWSQGINSSDKHFAVDSTPEKVSRCRTAFNEAAKHLTFENTKFIDLGCGKGRVLLLSARHNFKKRIGVELSENVAQICRSNLKSKNVEHEIIVDSMLSVHWEDHISCEDQILIYAYNPTSVEILSKTIAKIIAKVKNGKLLFIYTNPQTKFHIEKSTNFNLLVEFHKLHIYELSNIGG